ncbi:hypothetical protein SAMN05660690_2480 [Geodermatophilus telluris]|uniref:Uncharacterized protein n=1 Tax=Geodermatophilus telluris TaxID=1190417 RepID=A0A1G6PA12_9ACTN|nr:hypothetical protein [Geodermatophilus telluris]SDC77062.1 hypothetical protein SAMN05660690_2480 [Geodermatophilus telluris]
MTSLLRPDFATASAALVGNAQRQNLARLHTWLVDEVGLLPGETVLAVSNYQEGSFGRLPNHVVLVTDQRIAFTHDGGLRSIPLSQIDATRVGLRTGLVNGELTLLTTGGEALRFKKGVSLAIQEVAEYTIHGAAASVPVPAPDRPLPRAPRRSTEPSSQGAGQDSVTGTTDQLVRAHVPGAQVLRVEHSGSDHFAVFEVTEAGDQGELLVNVVGRYSGTLVCGQQGPLAGFEVSASGPWSLTLVPWGDVPRWRGHERGTDSGVLVLPAPAQGLVSATITYRGFDHLAVTAHGADWDLLVNHVGAYRGQVRIPPGTEYLVVDTTGPWEAVLD